MDSEVVTCAVSITRGRGTACVKIQEAVVEVDRKEAEQLCVILSAEILY